MFKSNNHILTVLIVDGAHIHLWKTEHRDRCLSSSNFQSTRAPLLIYHSTPQSNIHRNHRLKLKLLP